MQKLLASLVLSAAMALTSVVPVSAASYTVPSRSGPEIGSSSDIVPVRRRGGFYRHGGHYYYNGHRGYHDYRRGYRRHNGVYFPLAAFAAGAIIGGIAQNGYYGRPVYRERRYYAPQPVYRSYGGAHVAWCEGRYRSYRAYDNSFQPYHGPRRQCYSPYN